MKNKISKILLASFFAATCAFAQKTHTPPDPATIAQRRVAHLTRFLTLTTAQQQQATNIFTNSATADLTLHTNLRTAHTALADAVKKNDTAGIDRAANTIGSVTAQLTSNDGKANAAFYQILTPEQQTKVGSFRGGQGAGMMRGGPGRGGANFRQRSQQ